MTSDDLLSIGDFARTVGLSASALRHYSECGLLVPAHTDAATGYRYYTPALEQRARLVAMMRDVGVPIETMRAVLDGRRDDAHAALEALGADREAQASRTRDVIATVLATLDAVRAASVARVRVDGPALAAALRQVRPAADSDPASALTSVLVDVGRADVDVVATNRHWLACRTMAGVTEVGGGARAVLTLPSVADLAERLDRTDDVTLVIADGHLSLDDGSELEAVPTVDLPYPAHRIVLAGVPEPTTVAVVDREELIAAATCAGQSLIDLRCDDAGLAVTGAPVAAAVHGKPVELRFRSALLLRAVVSCVGPRVRLRLSEDSRPVALGSPDQPGYVALVMPTLEQP